jgi:hypothetical protein
MSEAIRRAGSVTESRWCGIILSRVHEMILTDRSTEIANFCGSVRRFSNLSMSGLHSTRLCRTEPVAPALPCADLIGAERSRRVITLCGWRPFIPSQ